MVVTFRPDVYENQMAAQVTAVMLPPCGQKEQPKAPSTLQLQPKRADMCRSDFQRIIAWYAIADVRHHEFVLLWYLGKCQEIFH